jgi:hypothetical protein
MRKSGNHFELVANMLRSTLLSLAIVAGAAPAMAQSVNDQSFLDLVGSIEGPDGYNDVVQGATSQPPKPLTEMTIAEVLDYQRQLQLQGSTSTAVGRYQFIRKTLSYIVSKHQIDPQTKFSKRIQDDLARQMMRNCNFYDSGTPVEKVGNCLARAWAALPVLSGENAGLSHYDGVAGNAALTTREEVLAALNKRFKERSARAPVRYAMAKADLMPVIRNQSSDRFADPIPLRP